MLDYQYGRRLEREGKWREAEAFWNKYSGTQSEDAAACKMIADAIEAGDRKREEDKTTEYKIIETIGGHFSYFTGKEPARIIKRVIGQVYGISAATEIVVRLRKERESLKEDFPNLDI